jgi:branched-chain amino acid transport system substrate-binding protein
LIDSGLPLIVGYYTSAAAAAALEVPEADRAVLVSPSATSDSLDGKVDALFRTIMSSRKDASILLSDMKARGLGTLVVLAYAGNEPYAETYVKPLRGRIAIAADIRFDSIADIDYEALRRLREPAVPGAAGSPGYDAVLIIASPLDSGTIAQELAIKGLSAPLYVSGWAGTDDLITYGGAAVEGTVFVHQADGSLPGVAELALRYKAAYKADPGYGAMQTWDAMLFVRAAIEAARGDEAAIGAAVRSIRVFEGISGPVSIDAFGDASRAVYLKRVEGGRIVVIGRAD